MEVKGNTIVRDPLTLLRESSIEKRNYGSDKSFLKGRKDINIRKVKQIRANKCSSGTNGIATENNRE